MKFINQLPEKPAKFVHQLYGKNLRLSSLKEIKYREIRHPVAGKNVENIVIQLSGKKNLKILQSSTLKLICWKKLQNLPVVSGEKTRNSISCQKTLQNTTAKRNQFKIFF